LSNAVVRWLATQVPDYGPATRRWMIWRRFWASVPTAAPVDPRHIDFDGFLGLFKLLKQILNDVGGEPA
jgi:hypothetical protein